MSVRVTYYSSGPAYYSEDEGTTYRTTLEGQEEEVRTSVVNSLCFVVWAEQLAVW